MANRLTQKARKESIKNSEEREVDIVGKIKTNLTQEISQDWKIAMQQMLGVKEDQTQANTSGDLNEGEEMVLSKQEKRVNAEPAINYFREIIQAETMITRKDESHLEAKIQEILIELKKLSESSQELQVEFKDVTTAMLPVKPGKYHLNFFEWMLATIQNARMRIEDSAAWVGVLANKKNKKDYWSSVKSQGTSFMLSGERVVAQQTG